MKIHQILFGFFLLGILGCSDNEFDVRDFFDDSSIITINGTWKVVSFENFNSDKVEFKTKENSWGYDINIAFKDTVSPHEFWGRNTTNSINGKFEYIGDRQFRILVLRTTFINEPEWGHKFSSAITDGIVSFKINTEQLRIYYDNKRKSVTLTKE
jgi:hypothetical protein